VASRTGNDPDPDSVLLRLHTGTAHHPPRASAGVVAPWLAPQLIRLATT
jgi:hypothetical protein